MLKGKGLFGISFRIMFRCMQEYGDFFMTIIYMEYYQKYIKYKTKYANIKKSVVDLFVNMHGGTIDATLINGSVLGFGTDGIFEVMELEPGNLLLDTALTGGYILFDTAYAYGNIPLIGDTIRKFGRDNVFVNYKVVLTPNESKDLKKLVQFGIEHFDYVDCLMYHTIPTVDQLREDLPYIGELCRSGKVKTIGFSNLFPIGDGERLKQLLGVLHEYEMDQYFKFLEEEFSISIQDKRKDDIEICQRYGIKTLGYSAFGGKGYGVCSFTINPNIAYPQFNRYSHPKTWAIIENEKLDPAMLNMAFLASKYGVVQLPTSRRSERIKSNMIGFNKAYRLLSANRAYVDTIYDETRTVEGLQYNLIYVSRVKLYDALKEIDYGIKIWNDFYNPYYREIYDNPRRFDRLSQSMLIFLISLIEHALPKYAEYQLTMQNMYSLLDRLKAENTNDYVEQLKKFEQVIKQTFCGIDVSGDKLNSINLMIASYELIRKFKKSVVIDGNYYDPKDEYMLWLLFNKDDKDYVMPISGRFRLDEFITRYGLTDTKVIGPGGMEIDKDDLFEPVGDWRRYYSLNKGELIILETGVKSFWHNPDGSINMLIFKGPTDLSIEKVIGYH
jgi:diketogulonate reductase-like aldo/keto reductase